MRYSLANYSLTIQPDENSQIDEIYGSITIGGQGKAIGSITISRSQSMYSTKGYATGGWVHSKNLDKTGGVSININQMSPEVAKLISLANVLYSGDYEKGLLITISNINGNDVAYARDSFIEKIPDQQLDEEASDQTWEFTSGEVDFKS